MLILDRTNELYLDLNMCDVLCHPSYREGFGTVVIQASLLEKPIICSDTYGLRDTIFDNVTGLRHRVGDVEEIHSLMSRCLSKTLRMKLGQKGRAYVRENYSSKTITEHWLQFYLNNVL